MNGNPCENCPNKRTGCYENCAAYTAYTQRLGAFLGQQILFGMIAENRSVKDDKTGQAVAR